MSKFIRVLSIDGGGIRGVIPGQILVELEEKLRKRSGNANARIGEYFDMIAGTSTGGILACAYLAPRHPGDPHPRFNAQEVVDIYREHGDQIFNVPLHHRLRTLYGFMNEKYPSSGLEEVLDSYFGKMKLSQLMKPNLITAYDTGRRKSWFFRQQNAHKPSRNFFVKDVLLATSAAPAYFEIAKVKAMSGKQFSFIDGGVFANNPALCAYAEARIIFKKKDYPGLRATAIDMVVVSLGTGRSAASYDYNKTKYWGLGHWAKPMMDMMMSGQAETVDYQLRQIYDSIESADQYIRINTTLPKEMTGEMDDASANNIQALIDIGNKTAKKHNADLNRIADMLLE
ncbi:MAG: CBASS cGAMP-activated phospholipase [Bacteroidia bacterium]